MSYYTRNDLFWLQGPNESIPIILTIEENELFISRQNDALSSAAETKEGYDLRTVKLTKQNNALGLVIKGGSDSHHALHISGVKDDSPAALSPAVQVGDILIKINDTLVQDMKHNEAIDFIKNSDGDTVTLQVISAREKETACPNDGGINLLTINGIKVPLALSYITRYSNKRNQVLPAALQVITKEKKEYILGCKTKFNELVTNLSDNILSANKKEVTALRINHDDLKDLLMMCWVNELMASSKQSKVWTKRLLVLRTEELEIYTHYPESAEEWQSREVGYGVCDITWKHLVHDATNSYFYRPHSILLQSATGVQHIISFECDLLLQSWEKELTKEIKSVVKKINARTFAAKWDGNAVDLTIDLESGFIIEDSTTSTKLWSRKFEELVSSSDDGNRQLCLSFNDDNRESLELTELFSVLYTIEAFLKTRIDRLHN